MSSNLRSARSLLSQDCHKTEHYTIETKKRFVGGWKWTYYKSEISHHTQRVWDANRYRELQRQARIELDQVIEQLSSQRKNLFRTKAQLDVRQRNVANQEQQVRATQSQASLLMGECRRLQQETTGAIHRAQQTEKTAAALSEELQATLAANSQEENTLVLFYLLQNEDVSEGSTELFSALSAPERCNANSLAYLAIEAGDADIFKIALDRGCRPWEAAHASGDIRFGSDDSPSVTTLLHLMFISEGLDDPITTEEQASTLFTEEIVFRLNALGCNPMGTVMDILERGDVKALKGFLRSPWGKDSVLFQLDGQLSPSEDKYKNGVGCSLLHTALSMRGGPASEEMLSLIVESDPSGLYTLTNTGLTGFGLLLTAFSSSEVHRCLDSQKKKGILGVLMASPHFDIMEQLTTLFEVQPKALATHFKLVLECYLGAMDGQELLSKVVEVLSLMVTVREASPLEQNEQTPLSAIQQEAFGVMIQALHDSNSTFNLDSSEELEILQERFEKLVGSVVVNTAALPTFRAI